MNQTTGIHLKVLREEEPAALGTWHAWLHHESQRGERARLRRAASLDAVIVQHGFFDLARRLPRLETHLLDGLALVAGILSWVEVASAEPLAALLGRSKPGGDTPLFSELRFQRLLASDTHETFFQNLRRAVLQAGKTANPLLLADSILHWEQERRHPEWEKFQGRGRWQYRQARAYYIQH